MSPAMSFDDKIFVLGIGAQKAGTTWLHDYLIGRGDIFMPKRKELHYFDAKHRPDLQKGKKRQQPRRPPRIKAPLTVSQLQAFGEGEDYREYFRSKVPDEISHFGEITPAYSLIGVSGFREIRHLFRNVRLIYIMRDPAERFYSQYRMVRDRTVEKGGQPAAPLDLLQNREFVERSRYGITISAIDSVFLDNEIIYLFYETLFRPETIGKLCDFLGIPYMPANFDNVVRPGGEHHSIPPELERRIRAKFKGTYKFCRQRFGDAVPPEWRSTGNPQT